MTVDERTVPELRRWPLWAGAGVLGFTALVHIVAGTPETLPPLFASDLDPEIAYLLAVLWHLTSVLLVLMPLSLGWAARNGTSASIPLVVFVWIMAVVFVVLFLTTDIVAFGSVLMPLPQWILFAPVVLLLPVTLGAGAGFRVRSPQ
jgi:hypothetical protein